MKVLLLNAKEYDFKSDNGQVKGVKISYLTKENGEDVKGYPPIQSTISNSDIKTLGISELPGLYEADFTFVPGKNNAPTIQLSKFDLLSKVDFQKLFVCNK